MKSEHIHYIYRKIENNLITTLARGKSILLFRARQTGKTTLLSRIQSDLKITFALSSPRQLYERNPDLLVSTVKALPKPSNHDGNDLPLIIIDEVQKAKYIFSTTLMAPK